MESKYTPGPWLIVPQTEPRTVKIGTGEKGWLGVAQAFGDSDEEAQANSRLIAAAPELLETLKLSLPFLLYWQAATDTAVKVRAVIAKAEGR